MKLGLQQSVRGDLQLRLSPQILQRIEVLQLSALDLAEMVEQELQENETLELAEDVEPVAEPAEEEEFEVYEDLDEDLRPRVSEDAPTRMDLIAGQAALVSLVDHLVRQLDELDLDSRERALAGAIVEALDERGWLRAALDEVELELEPPPDGSEREHALHIVQGLEPVGVGARDLTECLLLQLDQDDPDYDLLVTLVVQHLDDIARNRIPRIVKATGADVDRVLAGIDLISHLDPIPGRRFGRNVPLVRPDLVVRRVGDDFEIVVENDGVPPMRISRQFQELVNDRRVDRDLRKHLRGKIESARSLMDAVEQRRNTLFRVASEIVNRQVDFLEHGPSALRPMRMAEIADVVGVHVSTVSRALSGKYIQIPRGIVPLKSLFTGEVASSGGGEQASRAGVQELVREIIAVEDKRRPLSDEAIVRALKQEHGLDIARRTVTKYRKALQIGSSRDE